jgi:acetyltransferase-like isoleucine patch superfamily enzyme
MLHWWSKIQTRIFTLLISSQFKEIGGRTRISPPFRCANLRQISLGHGVQIERDCWIHVVGGYGEENSPKLIIKSHAGIGMGATISAAQQVVIGEYALLARNVYISDHAHAIQQPC